MGLLGGQKELGETPKQTLLRELYEEANIKPGYIEFLDKTPWGSCLFLVKLTNEEFQSLKAQAEEGQNEIPKVEGCSWDELSYISLAQHIEEYLIKYRQQIQALLNDTGK